MLPILFTLGPVKIYTLGVFLVLAFFWGCFLLWKLIRLTPFKEEDVFDGLFWSLTGGIFAARLFYVLLNFKQFGLSILKFILINGYPGLSIYGMIIGGLLALFLFCYFKKIKFTELIDYFIPAFFLSLSFGKLGGFFSGEELVIKFASHFNWTQLISAYEALLFLLGSWLAYKIIFQIRKEKLAQGINLVFFLWYFSLVYFGFDKVKGYHLYFLNYSFNWIVSFIFVLTLSIYFLYYFRSSIKTYVRKIWKNIFGQTKSKIGGGQGKDSATNQ